MKRSGLSHLKKIDEYIVSNSFFDMIMEKLTSAFSGEIPTKIKFLEKCNSSEGKVFFFHYIKGLLGYLF